MKRYRKSLSIEKLMENRIEKFGKVRNAKLALLASVRITNQKERRTRPFLISFISKQQNLATNHMKVSGNESFIMKLQETA